jgi:uncharacterized protein involved in exopolysaccharide biosynthesis/Mrp family chromosome partitioning ATPase
MGDGLFVSDVGQPLDGLSARALFSSMRRHLPLVLAFTFMLCAAGLLIGLGLPAWFEADGVVVIHARPQRMAELQELPDATPDLYVIQSEADILQSRSVIEPVVRSLRLWEAPEFQKMEYPKGWNPKFVEMHLDEIWRDIRAFAGDSEYTDHQQLSFSTQPDAAVAPRSASQPTQAEVDTAVGKYAGFLGVGTDGHSMTIRVSFRAWTPERAAAIVNAHIDSYQKLEVETKVKAAERANSALSAQVTELRQQLQAAEMAITRYRVEHRLTGAAKDSGGVSQQLATLNSQLIAARADLAEHEARAARITAGAGADSLPEVVGSVTIAGLRSQEAQLVAHEADLSRQHGDEYPELQRVRASLQKVQRQISREVERGRAAALQMVERARTREQSLQQSVTELTNQLNSADAGLLQLQGKAESIRSLLLNFEKRMAETAADPAFITPKSTVASRANPSAARTSPKVMTLSFAGGFTGLTLGTLLSVLLELRDRKFRSSAEVQRHIGALTVNAIPRAVGYERRSPTDIILNDNRSAFAEAFRVSWANIQLAIGDPRSPSFEAKRLGTALAITSAASGEGKSTQALGLARTAALAGENVVIVDADLRRPGVSRLLDQDFSFTLRDVLQDRCTVNDVISIEQRSGVHFVPSYPDHAAWTNQDFQRFGNLIEYLKERFAFVIIDLPPILGLAEPIRLAAAADSIALVIRWGSTDRQFVQFALETLRRATGSTITVVLNDIDLRAQQRRGFRDHALVYADGGLYQGIVQSEDRALPPEPSSSTAADNPDADPEISGRHALDEIAPRDRPRPAGSDIERLYDRYHH